MTAGPGAEETPEYVVRGVAKVVKPPGVRALARVPGALSVPQTEPQTEPARTEPPEQRLKRRLPMLASPSTIFPRRVHPAPAPPPRPGLRPAAPPGDGPHPVPGKPRRWRWRKAALPTAAALLAAFATGTGYLAWTDRPQKSDIGRFAAISPETISAATSVDRPAGDPFGSAAAAPKGVPSRLRVSTIGVNTTLEQLEIDANGELTPPRAFGKAGWYAGGTAPGDTGPAVIAGHVDSRSGPAVFYRLRELTAGDRIEVVRGDAVVRFTVTRTAWYPKDEFPTEQVYGPTPDRQLRLITCGGVFDRSLRSYRDNLVVYAVAG